MRAKQDNPVLDAPAVYAYTPDKLILSLIRSGWSQTQIAVAVDTSQATVSRILSGAHRDPRHSLVEKLRRLVINHQQFDDLTK